MLASSKRNRQIQIASIDNAIPTFCSHRIFSLWSGISIAQIRWRINLSKNNSDTVVIM